MLFSLADEVTPVIRRLMEDQRIKAKAGRTVFWPVEAFMVVHGL